MAVSSAYNLVSRAAVKRWLGIPVGTTDADPTFDRLISAASRWLLNYCSRGNILSQSYTDRLNGSGWGQTSILLPRWPVTAVASVVINGVSVPISPTPGASQQPNGALLQPGDAFPPGAAQSIDLFGYGIAAGKQNIIVTYTAGYLIPAEPAAVPGAPGPYTISTETLAQPYGAWAADAGVTLANGTALEKVTGTPGPGQYAVSEINQTTGFAAYTFNAAEAGESVLISYSYVPSDLAQACIEMVAERFKYKDRIGESSKTLGGQETISYSLKDLNEATVSMLQNYKNVVPFYS